MTKIINTYYWKDRIKNPLALWYERRLLNKPWHNFRHGNAGDIFNENLLRYLYPKIPYKISTTNNRLLMVGSIAHTSHAGDIICGIGTKGIMPITKNPEKTTIYGLRGPITYDAFKKANYDLSKLKFLADPGLLIQKLAPTTEHISNNVIFIPHYRERKQVLKKLPKQIRFVDIDSDPIKLAIEIQRAELVLSSSLHGIIFSHALNRPAVLIQPSTEEPMLKYEDYFYSMDLNLPRPIASVDKVDFRTTPVSPKSVTSKINELFFPTLKELKSTKIYS